MKRKIKIRNPIARELPKFRQQVVPVKKGKGKIYKREKISVEDSLQH